MAQHARREHIEAARFMSVAEVARIFGVSDLTVYREIRAGRFPAIKFRGRYVVPTRAIQAMEDAAVDSRALVDPSSWVGVIHELSSGEPSGREMSRPVGVDQFAAGSVRTQQRAGRGEEATSSGRVAGEGAR